LQGHDGGALEAEIGLEILSDFSYETLEGELPDQKFGRLLITTDFSESYGTGPVTMGFLNTAGGGCALSGGLGSELLPRGFATGTLTSSLLSTCHS
jgi:hypothetical protein